MPYGGGTVSVGVRKEMESHNGLIHGRSGEIAHLTHRRGGEGVPAHVVLPLLLVITKCCPCSDVNLALINSPSLTRPSHSDSPSPKGSPSVNVPSPIERENNIMTQSELDRFRESYSIPSNVQIRLPEVNETIAFTRPGEETGVPRVPRSWGSLGKHCNIPPVLSLTVQKRLDEILDSLVSGNTFKIKEVLESKSFRRCSRSTPKSIVIVVGTTARIYRLAGQLQSKATRVSLTISEVKLVKAIIPMLRRIDAGKLAQMAKGSKASTLKSSKAAIPKISKVATSVAKGMVIREKQPRNEVSDISPSKKSKTIDDSKGKETMLPPDAKKKATKPIKTTSMGVKLREGTSVNPCDVLGLNASMLENPTAAEKLLESMVHPFAPEEFGKLDLDRAIPKLFYRIGHVVILASSLTGHGTELRDEAMTQQARADSIRIEMARA
ncbi:hypothetical protein Acr_15g0010110 [Actinidia rufa]|uniref:Uncharacterized protein n=1 Tax=Actinidia rufa TaxID=165716 RepID=A0A7J0FUQ2_9ERIC|nr:hypothetical protein Acr_15g0010110 [Actinidia rufa]